MVFYYFHSGFILPQDCTHTVRTDSLNELTVHSLRCHGNEAFSSLAHIAISTYMRAPRHGRYPIHPNGIYSTYSISYIPPFVHIAHMNFETETHLYIAHVSSYYCTTGRLVAPIMRHPAHSEWKKHDIMRAVMMKAVSVCVSGMYWYITGWYVSKHSR